MLHCGYGRGMAVRFFPGSLLTYNLAEDEVETASRHRLVSCVTSSQHSTFMPRPHSLHPPRALAYLSSFVPSFRYVDITSLHVIFTTTRQRHHTPQHTYTNF
ncbi:hypothetical protein E2C01_005683 [Portunus trituberculatus]|uniref:Uncharacterized protein n=1 Tax=Portunus trituberculatus TaxID=210409 RepID=A0A5B7CT16_PORTR|nr:hypothetical protein [Portunus trituberculatus]